MKAAISYEFGKPLVVEEVDFRPPTKGEVKVKIAASSICHSDINAIKGEVPVKLPSLGGHEASGYVEEIGEGVTSVKRGDHVVLTSEAKGCGYCINCLQGLRNMCENRTFPEPDHFTKKGEPISRAAGSCGFFTEYTSVPEDHVIKISEDMPMDRAALLACGVMTGFGSVVNRAQVKPFSSVVVIGAGGVGVNSIQGAVFCGAHPVIAVDVMENKLKWAKTFGATDTINAAKVKDPIQAVMELTSGRGADYVFITVGSIDAVRQGFMMSGPRGMTVVVGIAVGKLSAFQGVEFIRSEKILTGAQMGSSRIILDIPRYVTLYKAGRLKLDELITGRYPLEQINEAIESLDKGKALRNVIMFK